MNTKEKIYSVTMLEACEMLSKSKKTVGRYIRKGYLKPKTIKSRQGTPEYRFNEEELKSFRDRQERQELTSMTERTGDITYVNLPELKEDAADLIDLEEEERQAIEDTPDIINKPLEKEKTIDKKEENPETRKETQEKTDKLRQEGQEGNDGILGVLRSTIATLNSQLEVKDRHIEKLMERMGSLIERNKEMNYIVKSFQDKFPMLDAPKARRGRKPKIHGAEAVDIDIEEIKAEVEEEGREEKEASKPNKKEAQAEAEEQEKEGTEPEEKAEEKPKKKGFWKKLFTPYNLPQ